MKNKIFDMANHIGSKAGAVISTAATKASTLMQEHKPDAQDIEHAKQWVQKTATETATEVTRLGKETMKSSFAKDMAKGAAVGAVIAVPVPVIGPVIGAVVGASIGAYANLTRSKPPAPQQISTIVPLQTPSPPMTTATTPTKDIFTELLKLDELFKKGILTKEEFDTQKTKILGSV